MNRKTVKLQGFNVDTFDFETAVKYADSISGQVITINPEMINNARKNSDFADIINSAELVIPDGIGVEIGLKILGNSVRRIAGIEFAHKMLEVCAKEGKSVAFVGALGSPKQEEFIAKSKTMLPDSLFIGVGGSFDVWSGVVQRAPEIYQKLGLEWLYRTVKEPQRFKRIFPTLPLFVLNVLREKFIPKGV